MFVLFATKTTSAAATAACAAATVDTAGSTAGLFAVGSRIRAKFSLGAHDAPDGA